MTRKQAEEVVEKMMENPHVLFFEFSPPMELIDSLVTVLEAKGCLVERRRKLLRVRVPQNSSSFHPWPGGGSSARRILP